MEGSRRRLFAAEMDSDRALERWLRPRKGALGTAARRGTYLDDADVDRLLDLSLPGVDELVALFELKRLSEMRRWDRVVVDTAPTGHTMRLLAMPDTVEQLAGLFGDMQAKHRFLVSSLGRRTSRDRVDATLEGSAKGPSSCANACATPSAAPSIGWRSASPW